MKTETAKEFAADCRRWASQAQADGNSAGAAEWMRKASDLDEVASNARAYAAKDRELAKRIAASK